MTKAEFKERALKVLDGISSEEELMPWGAAGGCLCERVFGRGAWWDLEDVTESWFRPLVEKLIPTSASVGKAKIAPLPEIRAWVETL